MEFDSDDSDEELVLQVQKGNTEAFAMLVTRHTDYLYRIVWRTYPDIQEAEDIVQDVFLKYWMKPKQFDLSKGTRFRTWLTRVAMNRAIDMSRKKKPIPDYEYLLQQSMDDPNIPLHELEQKVEKMELEQAILNLPERQQQALNLCFYEDLKQKEAAEVMDVSVKALESLLMRAKKALYQILIDRKAGQNVTT